MKWIIAFVVLMFAFLHGFTVFSQEQATAANIILQNAHWQLTIEPRWGGRTSSMVSLRDNYDFVSHWGDVVTRRKWGMEGDFDVRAGGIFRSMMSGSYFSEQPENPYTVASSSESGAVLRYEHRYYPMDGLHEERRINLAEKDVVFSVKVTNHGKDDRIVYYRIHDWPGVGRNQGMDSVYIVPKSSEMPVAFTGEPSASITRGFSNPAENWYALADLTDNRGLLVQSKAPVAGFFFWGSGTNATNRTGEIFFPRTQLAPGESWEMEVRYTAFAPEQPDTGYAEFNDVLTKDSIEEYLAAETAKMLLTRLPFNSEMSLPGDRQGVTIAPVHPASDFLGGSITPNYGKTLEKIFLSGTPGEVVSLAFIVTANRGIKNAVVDFSTLQSGWFRSLSGSVFEPRYVAGESLLLVNSWELARNVPYESISHINNDVVDAGALTSFSLERGDSAQIWTNLRIPPKASAGIYKGKCSIDLDGRELVEFEINLTIRPFKLIEADHKTYGTFFDYHLKSHEDATAANPYRITREEYFEVMKVFRDIGCRGLVSYLSDKDDILWFLDRTEELGMKGDFIFLRTQNITLAEVKEKNIAAYGMVMDQPSQYMKINRLFRQRYGPVAERGFTTTWTSNMALAVLLHDLPAFSDSVPFMATLGHYCHLAADTGRFKDEGRKVWWYEAHGLGVQSVEQRALRGIYLWKEPVDGIFDWDNSSNRPNLSKHHMAGFAGTKVLPRLGLENTRQALTDLNYLHTLETLAGKTRKAELRDEAEQLMDWIKERFEQDYHNVVVYMPDSQYLDDIRQEVAAMIEKLVKNR